ncbi:MAG TPA: ABC transporter substrate-binding protein [Pyrinomonadaceae bacterium]|jgi:peptide/nickel transport system substrate-binding protein
MRDVLLRRLLPAALAAIWLVGCTQPAPSPNANTNTTEFPATGRTVGRRGGTLTYRVSAPPKTFNYVMAVDEATNVVAFFLTGSRLVEFDHDKRAYVAALAESWPLGADGRTVEVTLRDGLKFSDGQPLTAEDVAFTLRALYDERVASPLYGESMRIGGKQIEAQVLDARRLRLTFPEQIATPENYLSNLAVLPRHKLEDRLKDGTFRDAYGIASDPQQIVTAGPFMAAAAAPGERVTLKRNPYYWKRDEAGNQLPYLDEVHVVVIPDGNNAQAQLQQGTVDIYDRLRPADMAALKNAQGAVRAVDLGPSLYADDLWFNQNEGAKDGRPFVAPAKLAWFKDVRFRRAVSHAIDRESIAANTYQGLATPRYGFVTAGNRAWVANDLPRTEYSLDKARALLQEAGFTTKGTTDAPELYDARGNRVEFTLIVSAENEARAKSALVVQEDLGRLGLKVNVAPIENTQLQSRINQTYDYEGVLYGTSVSEPDPSSYADVLRSSSASHFWYPSEPKPATDWEARLDELTAQQAHEPDVERRRALFRDIQLLLAEQLPMIPIVTRHIPVAANTRLGNYRPSPLPPFSLWNAEELFVRQ